MLRTFGFPVLVAGLLALTGGSVASQQQFPPGYVDPQPILDAAIQAIGNDRLNILKECFLTCVKPYMVLLSDWVSQVSEEQLQTKFDFKSEFFIKPNTQILVGHVGLANQENDIGYQAYSARKQWSESYVFRTINISALLNKAKGEEEGLQANLL